MIGFIGLVVPHVLRLAVGPDHRVLLPASALAGASLLLFADLAARLIFGAGRVTDWHCDGFDWRAVLLVLIAQKPFLIQRQSLHNTSIDSAS